MRRKGHRLRLSDRYDVALTAGFLFAVLFSPFLFYVSAFMKLSETDKLKTGLGIGLIVSLLTLMLLVVSYRFVPFFRNKRDNRLVLSYLLSNQFYETVKGRDGKDRIKLSPVYVKKLDYATLAVTVEMKGKLLRELERLPEDLEKLFFADFKARNDFKEARLFSKHAYSQFVFSDNKEAQRLRLSELHYDERKGIRLMDGEAWDFIHSPHLLIAGGTGGGKTIFLLSLLTVLAPQALLEICDPKKSDLSVLDNFKVFKGHVYSELDDIIDCLKRAVEFMDARYRQMGLDSENPEEVKIGNNYQSYGLLPKFILVDEWMAFMAALDISKARKVDDLMAQLILKGRQAGIFLIVAMQRPDAEYLSTNLRDNMVGRISLGKLSKTGYRMIFGEDYAEKNYLFIKSKIGRGYAALDGGMPSEFFSPLISFEEGFSFESVFQSMKPLEVSANKTKPSQDFLTLAQLSTQLEIPGSVLSRLVGYLHEAGYEFKEGKGNYNCFDETMLKAVKAYKDAHSEVNWKRAVQTVLERKKQDE